MNEMSPPPAELSGDDGEPPSRPGGPPLPATPVPSPEHASARFGWPELGGGGGRSLASPRSGSAGGEARREDRGVAGVRATVEDATGALTGAQRGMVERLSALAAAEALRGAGAAVVGGTVGVRIVGDREMAARHEALLGAAGTTDVISFDLTGGRALAEGLEADLLVCLDEASRQASARGHAVESELVLYALHGVLHGLGYGDGDERGAARMHAEEDRVLREIGVGAVYGGVS